MNIQTRPVTQCLVCGGSGRALYEDLKDRAYGVSGRWKIAQCLECGSGWLNPAPVPEQLGECYAGSYYTHEIPEPATLGKSRNAVVLRSLMLSTRKGYTTLNPSMPLSKVLGSILARIPPIWSRACFGNKDLLPPFKPGGRLLEIGCGDGRFLSIMQLLGWEVCGVEPDPIAARVAATATGCHIHVGTIENAPFEMGQFDAIISSHVIEHVYDPRSFVAGAARFLAENGIITVLTPNFRSVGHRMFGADWYCLDPPRHMCLFTPKSIKSLFADSGLFRYVRTKTITRASKLAIARQCAVRSTGNFLAGVEGNFRMTELLFRALALAGNRFMRWGEEIQCVAVRSGSPAVS